MGSTNNGGDYVACRRALLSMYARPWLLALHGLQKSHYTKALCEACLLSAKMRDYTDNASNTTSTESIQFESTVNTSFVSTHWILTCVVLEKQHQRRGEISSTCL